MIIADSTPLINFTAIHRLDILEQLFESMDEGVYVVEAKACGSVARASVRAVAGD